VGVIRDWSGGDPGRLHCRHQCRLAGPVLPTPRNPWVRVLEIALHLAGVTSPASLATPGFVSFAQLEAYLVKAVGDLDLRRPGLAYARGG